MRHLWLVVAAVFLGGCEILGPVAATIGAQAGTISGQAFLTRLQEDAQSALLWREDQRDLLKAGLRKCSAAMEGEADWAKAKNLGISSGWMSDICRDNNS